MQVINGSFEIANPNGVWCSFYDSVVYRKNRLPRLRELHAKKRNLIEQLRLSAVARFVMRRATRKHWVRFRYPIQEIVDLSVPWRTTDYYFIWFDFHPCGPFSGAIVS